ncbi:hypothetical protein ACVWXQ_009085 [Bradyrhizobium sp. S3.14.4]
MISLTTIAPASPLALAPPPPEAAPAAITLALSAITNRVS